MRGKIFVIDGSDGSGKETQTKKILNRLKEKGEKVILISYPDYTCKSSTLVKMYLNAELGEDVNCLDYFQSSSLFAVDRLVSFKIKWEKFYNEGWTIILDRYISANIIHQAAKIKTIKEKIEYINYWLDFEYHKLKLPIPDKVYFLNMPPKYTQLLINDRENKITNEKSKDIHEKDIDFLNASYKNALFVSDLLKWTKIDCVKDTNSHISLEDLYSIEEINDYILEDILDIINDTK